MVPDKSRISPALGVLVVLAVCGVLLVTAVRSVVVEKCPLCRRTVSWRGGAEYKRVCVVLSEHPRDPRQAGIDRCLVRYEERTGAKRRSGEPPELG